MQTAQKLHCTHLDCRDLLEHAPIPSPLEPHPTPPPPPWGKNLFATPGATPPCFYAQRGSGVNPVG